jgi:hypothetical protein
VTQVGAPPPQALQWQTKQGPPTITRELGPRQLFPTEEQQLRRTTLAKERAIDEAERERWLAMGGSLDEYRQMEMDKARRAARGGFAVREGNIHQLPDGRWVQDLYDSVGNVTGQIPAMPPRAGGTRPPNPAELAASELFGTPGEDPRDTLIRLGGDQRKLDQIQQLVQSRAAQTAGGVTTARGQASADIPLSTQQRYAAITGLQEDWRKLAAPRREMERQLSVMKTSFSAAERDPAKIPAASEAIILSFERMLDPDSVVREAEARRPGSMQSLLTRIEGAIAALRQGGPGIALSALKPYVTLSEEILKATETVLNDERKRIGATATEFGLDPNLILGAPTVGTAPPATRKPAGADTVIPGLFVDDQGNLIQKP